MPYSPVEQTLSVYAHAIEATDLTRRAALQAARSWVGATEATLPIPSGQPSAWSILDMGLDSAELFVIAQTRYARSLLEGAAEALGALIPEGTPPPTPVEPAALTATVAEVARPPKPAKRAGATSTAPTTRSNARRTAPRRPPAA